MRSSKAAWAVQSEQFSLLTLIHALAFDAWNGGIMANITINNTTLANLLVIAPVNPSVTFNNVAGGAPVPVNIAAGGSIQGNYTFASVTLSSNPARIWTPQAAFAVANPNVFWFEMDDGQFVGKEMAPGPHEGQFHEIGRVRFV
ncbi:hypothetical protein NM208_g2339 [Fusarium decemcellulare]|uniref:Uncharacterized protein n=1 Tax=Fusarium decemcellulare TaxID=57161 RepID=A0ACC1SSV4_9HYPO|nr:hypothetical protein NM208_g2339 [Fusarium decemcellulare]